MLTDETTLATYTLPAYTVNIASVVGGPTAYIGFTAGSGGDSSTETISSLAFTPAAVPEPASIGAIALGGIALAARRRRRSV
jgi:hypothetical protein